MAELESGITSQDTEQPIEMRGSDAVMERVVMHDRFGMAVLHDTIKRQDGTEGHYYTIDFKNPAVMTFPMDQDKNIYMAEEFAYAINNVELAGAGGSAQPGETNEDAAIREVREELGVEVSRLRKVGTYREITSRVRNETHVYLADFESVGVANPETGEDIRLEKLPFETVFEMVRKGVINNAVVSAAIYAINELAREEDEQQPN